MSKDLKEKMEDLKARVEDFAYDLMRLQEEADDIMSDVYAEDVEEYPDELNNKLCDIETLLDVIAKLRHI